MIVVEFLFGVLASAIVAYIDGLDRECDEKQRAKIEELRAAVERLRSPTAQGQTLLNQTLRDIAPPGSPLAALNETIVADPALGVDLTQWLLEPDPQVFAQRVTSLAAALAQRSGCTVPAIEGFLRQLNERVNSHFPLAHLRGDRKLSEILTQLRALNTLPQLVEQNRVIFSLVRRLLDRDKQAVLTPVRPVPRQPSKTNGLLSGARPTDVDMDQDIDFRRRKFPQVMDAIHSAATQRANLPIAFLFLADVQRGKSTFLRRVGWELAKTGYPVVELSPGSITEPYGRWVQESAAETISCPLVLLIDDPFKECQNFENQMAHIHNQHVAAIVLIASRPTDWREIKSDTVPLLHRAQQFDLNPDRYEAKLLVDKLAERGLLTIDPAEYDKVIREVEELPFSQRYFHDVIRIASKDEYKAMPTLVSERLGAAYASSDPSARAGAAAFERVYSFVCVPGLTGLGFPETLLGWLTTEDERYHARVFNEAMPKCPIRYERGALGATHESHAAAFLDGRDPPALLTEVAALFASRPDAGDFIGLILETLRTRGARKAALAAWAAICPRVTTAHWQACDGEVLTRAWGSFLYHLKQTDLAAEVNRLAVQRLPESAFARNNYALSLEAQGEPDRAREQYDAALRIEPNYDEVHNNYAILLDAQGEPDRAREHLEAALRISPDYAEAHNNYANLLSAQGEPDRAREHYETALRINPDYAEPHSNYANLLSAQGEPDRARQHYEAALRINPDYVGAHNNYAVLLQVQGELDRARQHYETVLRIDPDCAEAHYNYSVLLKAQGEPDRAREHCEAALRINPGYADAHNKYAALLEAQGEPDRAREHYETALRINPNHAEAAANFAELKLRSGDAEGALELSVRAIFLGSLPDCGKRIPAWFVTHATKLEQIVEDSRESPTRRGGALAMLAVLRTETATALAKKWESAPEFAEAARLCGAIFAAWGAVTPDNPPPPASNNGPAPG